MRRLAAVAARCSLLDSSAHGCWRTPTGDDAGRRASRPIEEAVRVTIIRTGGEDIVRTVSGGSAGAQEGCAWSLVFAPELEDAPYGISPGPEAAPRRPVRAAALQRGDRAADLGGARTTSSTSTRSPGRTSQRYIEDVLVPGVAHRREPGGSRARRARLVVLDRGLRRLGHGAADHRVRHDHRRAPVVGLGGAGTSATASRRRRPRPGLPGRVDRPARPPARRHLHDHRHHRPRARVPGRRRPLAHPPDLQATATVDHDVEERQAVITKT